MKTELFSQGKCIAGSGPILLDTTLIPVPIHEPYEHPIDGKAPDENGVWPVVPLPITKRTLIIWVKRGCMACTLNKSFFAHLEKQTDVMPVVRVEATNENISKYEVSTLPRFDIVTPRPSSHSFYGPNTHLVSIRNDQRDQLMASGFRRFIG